VIIENSVMADAVEIARLYESARDLQKIKGAVCWPLFDKKIDRDRNYRRAAMENCN
jgi:hypothetical protein